MVIMSVIEQFQQIESDRMQATHKNTKTNAETF